ncbi:reverse transcriptase [Phytophthora megakarya]|uniref:Reverse transcriptase n=1 Tax=Phytophthora megakarya TaxID=4795 RepID=A0A225WS26_9STRA|nr:reverse transcriptase [Phytophthora megakarya]
MPPELPIELEEPSEVYPGPDDSGFHPETAPCTPLEKREVEYERCMIDSAEELDLEPGVYIHEGSEMLAQLRDQLLKLKELSELHPECDIDQADVGYELHRKIFLGDGKAAPAPVRGVVCDLDVGDAKPIALRPRLIGPHVAVKVHEPLKKLLENNQIEHSKLQWASPIVIVLKKNGVGIRIYPQLLIEDLLVGFEKAVWFMGLDMASRFWVIGMTERSS